MELILSSLKDLAPSIAEDGVAQARVIFFESAGNPLFSSIADRDRFQNRYFDSYLSTPDLFFLATREQKVLGYLAGAKQTLGVHFELNPYLEDFRSLIEADYPAHLHINLSALARGAGIGSNLISAYESYLRSIGVKGVHLVTSSSARNVSFYLKNSYAPLKEAEWNGKTLLLMAKPLPPLKPP